MSKASNIIQPSLRDSGALEFAAPNVETLGYLSTVPPGREPDLLQFLEGRATADVTTAWIERAPSKK